MRERAYIDTPFPTAKQTAEVMKVGPRRAAQLIQMVEEVLLKRGYNGAKKVTDSGTAQSSETHADKSSRVKSRARVTPGARKSRNASRTKPRAKAKRSH